MQVFPMRIEDRKQTIDSLSTIIISHPKVCCEVMPLYSYYVDFHAEHLNPKWCKIFEFQDDKSKGKDL